MLSDISRYTEHIDSIVKLQQRYATKYQLQEPTLLAALIEDAVRINAAGLVRHEVKVEQHLAPLPPVLTDNTRC